MSGVGVCDCIDPGPMHNRVHAMDFTGDARGYCDGSACHAIGRRPPAHRADLLVQTGAQDDGTYLVAPRALGGILSDVTNLGDNYTPTEARVNRIFDRLISRIVGIIMGAAEDAVRGVTDQLNKAKGEIDAEVAKLQEAGVSDEALAGLKAVSQSLDDRNPDAPEPTPEPEPAAESSSDPSGW